MLLAAFELAPALAVGDTVLDGKEAVEIANDVLYGLAGGVWTENMRRAIRMSERLEAGTVRVSMYRANASLFGGYTFSGLGREIARTRSTPLCRPKGVWIDNADTVPNPFVIG